MKKRVKIVASLLLTLSVLMGMLCVGSVTVSAGGVDDRLAQVQAIFPEGSYFTTTGGPVSANIAPECYYPNVVSQRLGYNWTNMWSSWSCCGFAHFVYRYVFGREFTDSGAAIITESGTSIAEQHELFSSSRPGDVFYWSSKTYGDHWFVFLAYESGSHIWAYDSNDGGTNRVAQYNRFDMSYIANDCVYLKRYRATNYDAINGTTSYNTVSIPAGNYMIWNHGSGNQLVVEGSADVSQQNIGVHPITSESGMKFEITEESNGHRIRPFCSATKVVNTYADTVSSGNNVNLFENTANDTTQRWLFEPVDSGYYIIRNAQNPSCVLTQQNEGYSSNCIVADYTGSNFQKWGLKLIETEKPVISDVQISDITAEGYTITCSVADNIGVRRILYRTWTTANDWNDLQDASLNGTTVTFRVDCASRNYEYGEYITDISAIDSSGNETLLRVKVIVTKTGAVITEPVPEEDPYLTVTIETVEHAGTVVAGEEIALELTASAVEDITALDMRLCFDDTKLEFVSGEFKGTLGGFDIKSFNGSPAAAETDGAEVWLTAAKTSGSAALNDCEVIASVTLRALTDITADEAVRAYRCEVTSQASLVGAYELAASWIDGGVTIVDYPRGDINRDGRVSLSDAMRAFYAVNGQILLDAEEVLLADVDGDGEVGIRDAMRIFYCVNGVIDSL